MPWSTPTLREVRSLVRDSVRAKLPGADALVPNSVLRVLSDNQGALCHLTLQYVDWLALQLLPDTAETEWLSRHGAIWLVNADGSTGRKLATLASGVFTVSGSANTVAPQGMRFSTPLGVEYESLEPVTLGASGSPTPVRVRALDAGAIGNLDPGSRVGVGYNRPVNVDDSAVVITMTGGADEESDDQLRFRVLQRIREPPVGGAQHDYVNWVLRVPGVTRAWASPLEMGMGTVTVRFLMDDLRASNSPPGWPLPEDIAAVRNYLNTVRPVAVKDFFVEAPIPQPIDVHINRLVSDDAATRAAIEASLKEMLFAKAEPGQTIFAAWKTYAIMSAPGVVSFDLGNCDVDDVMPSPGHMAILGNVTYGV